MTTLQEIKEKWVKELEFDVKGWAEIDIEGLDKMFTEIAELMVEEGKKWSATRCWSCGELVFTAEDGWFSCKECCKKINSAKDCEIEALKLLCEGKDLSKDEKDARIKELEIGLTQLRRQIEVDQQRIRELEKELEKELKIFNNLANETYRKDMEQARAEGRKEAIEEIEEWAHDRFGKLNMKEDWYGRDEHLFLMEKLAEMKKVK